jgi:hypothetical protein
MSHHQLAAGPAAGAAAAATRQATLLQAVATRAGRRGAKPARGSTRRGPARPGLELAGAAREFSHDAHDAAPPRDPRGASSAAPRTRDATCAPKPGPATAAAHRARLHDGWRRWRRSVGHRGCTGYWPRPATVKPSIRRAPELCCYLWWPQQERARSGEARGAGGRDHRPRIAVGADEKQRCADGLRGAGRELPGRASTSVRLCGVSVCSKRGLLCAAFLVPARLQAA